MRQRTLEIIVKGAGYTAAGLLISKFTSYLFRIAVARLLDPAAYGQLSIGLAVLSFVNTFAMLSLGVAVKKYVPEYLQENNLSEIKGIILSAISITVPLSLLAGVLMFIFAPYLANQVFSAEQPQDVIDVIRVLAFVPLFGNTLGIVEDVFSAYRKVKYQVLEEMVLRNVLQLLITVALILQGLGVVAAAIGWLGATVLGLVAATIWMETKLGPILSLDVKPAFQRRKILRYSAPLVLSAAAGTLLSQIDTLMLGVFLTETQVGFYNAALPTAALILLPYQAISNLVMPSISDLKERSQSDVSKTVQTVTRWALMSSLPIFGGLVLFPGEILKFLFGSPYMSGSLALTILGISRIIDVATGYMSEVLSAHGHTKIIFQNSIFQLIVNIALNVGLIPILGIVGAAAATAGTQIVLNLILVLEAYTKEGINPFSRKLLKPLFALALSLFAVFSTTQLLFEIVPSWALVPSGLIFISVYGLTLILLGSFYDEDAEIIRAVGEKFEKEEVFNRIADRI